jgi:hypothetical protein
MYKQPNKLGLELHNYVQLRFQRWRLTKDNVNIQLKSQRKSARILRNYSGIERRKSSIMLKSDVQVSCSNVCSYVRRDDQTTKD